MSVGLDANRITLQDPPPTLRSAATTAPQQTCAVLAAALATLPRLAEVDLSANPLRDVAAAIFCREALMWPTLQLLHLAGSTVRPPS